MYRVNRHAKAPSSGSSTRQGSRLGALTTVAAFALAFVAFLGIGASAALAAPPTVTIDPNPTVGITAVKGTGTIETFDTGAEIYLEYTTDPLGAWNEVFLETVGPGTGLQTVNYQLTGLTAETEYHVRLDAWTGDYNLSPEITFTTGTGTGPDATTTAAKHINAESAYLEGTVNPNEESTVYWFEYGAGNCATTTCIAVPADKLTAGSGAVDVAASFALGGLSPATTYHFRVLAENASGTNASGDQTFTTAAAPASGGCPNEAVRTELHAGALGNCRAWELTSPDTNADIMANSGRTVAAASEFPGLPMAAKFSSLVGFGDVRGFGVATDYLTQRDANPGTSGWALHAITPPQEPLTYNAASRQMDPLYEYFSPDLSQGIFRSWSSLPGTSDNAREVPNLYSRDDVRSIGAGNYQLVSDSATLQPPLPLVSDIELRRPWLAGVSTDFEHLLFESRLNLTPDATGSNNKLYKSDEGLVRLVRANGACAGRDTTTANPCSGAGIGASPIPGGPSRSTPRVISSDGSRVNFTSPFGTQTSTIPNDTPGVVSKLYQLDDQGTPATDDDAVIQLSMSENPAPEPARAAIYQTASTDGSRVFFTSGEQLTAAPGSGLYMWQRQDEDETQQLAIDATGGNFILTAHTQPSSGEGELTEDETTVAMSGVANVGSFTVGQTIEGEGIPAGTTIAQVGTFANESQMRIVLSNPVEAGVNGSKLLTASIQATTAPLPWNATAAQVQSALESLDQIGTGNVSVSGGPAAGAPLAIEFTGALAGVDVMQLSADATGLSGGGSIATVTTTDDVRNLTLIGSGATAVFGASEDGHRIYFAKGDDAWLWQSDGSPAGALFHVASLAQSDTRFQVTGTQSSAFWNARPIDSRVTPDGGALLFLATNGPHLPPAYQHGNCKEGITGANEGFCAEYYIYRADSSTPTDPDIVCASCNLAVPGAAGNSFANIRDGGGASLTTAHLSRALSDDGNHVFFDSEEPLVPEDANGAIDVYEYDVPTGEAHLVSSGTDSAPSYLMDSSADGEDVFFVTRAQLAGWDDDQAYDLYDARAAGGFANPPAQTAACEGESCRGVATPAPGPTAPGSVSLVGPGNPEGGRKICPKGKRAVRRNGKTRCVKNHKNHKNHKRTANANRRAGK
jgi:hypothetical protein